MQFAVKKLSSVHKREESKKPAVVQLSYAQNLEDYYLAQAFGDQPRGFYIDVGAGHPVADNVSCWFYLRGWSGIVVEPQAGLAALYRHIRPRDTVVAALAGRADGEAAFHQVDRLHGFSTMLAEHAEGALAFGVGYKSTVLPLVTLASLCERHAVATVDFLKIDVEGAEADVLAGNDFTRLRPRVILLEALRPGDMAENWQGFEPDLLAQGYRFALFDGLNRYYVAVEDEALFARFPREKAPWLAVPHLGHTNRAPWRDDHPDHSFAKTLVGNFLAGLPMLDEAVLLPMLTRGISAERLDAPPRPGDWEEAVARVFPAALQGDARPHGPAPASSSLRELYRALMRTDAFRVMLGRLSMSFDGGQILD